MDGIFLYSQYLLFLYLFYVLWPEIMGSSKLGSFYFCFMRWRMYWPNFESISLDLDPRI